MSLHTNRDKNIDHIDALSFSSLFFSLLRSRFFHFRSRIDDPSKYPNSGIETRFFFFSLLPSSRVGKEIFHEKFPRSSESGLWYSHGNPLCRGYNQLNTSTPFNPVIVDTVHARTKGVVDFKLPLKLASSRRNLIPFRFTYRERKREREVKREENDFGSMGITDEVRVTCCRETFSLWLLRMIDAVMLIHCSYLNFFISRSLFLERNVPGNDTS